ncbi:1466_t:CDS:1, partial [Acaulospora morrowiae]
TVTLNTIKLPILKVFQFSQDTKIADLMICFSKGKKRNFKKSLENQVTFQQYLKSYTLQDFSSLRVKIGIIQKLFSDGSLE